MTRWTRSSAAGLLLTLLLTTGCAWGSGRVGDQPREMHRRFSRTIEIQTGVVLGDLERARAAAASLTGHEGSERLTGEARGYVDEMLGYAALIAQAGDLETVAAQTGHLAAACGSCHTATEGGPNFVLSSRPPEGESRSAVMIRHLWAADRMWEGLVGPSQEAWMAGAGAFGHSWKPFEAAFQAAASPEDVASLMAEIQSLARTAEAATTREARASVYGDILGTCNRCHRAAGVGARR